MLVPSSALSVTLEFSAGTYAISQPIRKRSNVHWRGIGTVARIDRRQPSDRSYPLVLARGVSGWSVHGLGFENVRRSVEIERKLRWERLAGASNACIDAIDCTEFSIAWCRLRDFSQGILYRGCSNFQIVNNRLRARGGKTIWSMLDGTYEKFEELIATGGIMFVWLQNEPALPAADFLIADNDIRVPGLDIGIEALSQTYDQQPGIVRGNIVRGCHAAIQAYRGGFKDRGEAHTYAAGLIIEGNRISATWEQGIYLRAVTAAIVRNNYIERAALVGSNGEGSSAGAIVTRVNPFASRYAERFVSAASEQVREDHPILIDGNMVIDPGRDGVKGDGAVQIRLPNVRLSNNVIVRSRDTFSSYDLPAILVDNGEQLQRYSILNNAIAGMFSAGSHDRGDIRVWRPNRYQADRGQRDRGVPRRHYR